MHHTYISSAVFTLRTKGSLSFSYHDCSNLLNDRFEKKPLFSSPPPQFCSSSSSSCTTCCCCCCCCASSAFATHRLHISPSLLYGLRQSNLIQCKRPIFGGRGQYYCRVPAYGPDHGGYKVSYCYRESSGRKRNEKGRKGKFGGINLRERQCVSGFNDVEAVLSLLSEEVCEEYIGDRGRTECLSKRVEIKERENFVGDCQEGKEKNVRLGLLESSSKCDFESATVDSRKEESRRKEQSKKNEEIEEAPAVSNGKNRRERKASSSFSSYYSLSSMEGFESDYEAHDEHGEVVEESSSGSAKNLQSGEARLEGQVAKEFEKHREGAKGQGEILAQSTTVTSNGFEWEMRKKSEKKFTEVEETRSRKESSHKHLRIAGTHERDYNKESDYGKKIDDKQEKATFEANLEKGRRRKSSQRDNQVKERSKFGRSYVEASNIQEIHGIDVETTSKSRKQFSDRDENLMVDANLIHKRVDHHHKIYHESSREENLGRNTQQHVELSEFGKFDMEGVSNFQRHSESGVKIHEEDSKRTSVLQLETRSKNHEGSTNIVSSSGAATKEQFSSDHNALQRIQSGRGSQDVSNISVNVTNVSVLHATDIKTVNNTQSTSENRVIDQGSTLTSVVKPVQEPRQTDESFTQFKSGNEAYRVAKVSKSHDRTSHQASSSQGSLNRVSQERKQQMEEDQRSSQPIMLPPSSQIVDRGSLLVDHTMEIASEEISVETSENGSSAFYASSGRRTPACSNEPYGRHGKGEIYREPLKLLVPQDALGSAHRLVESSTHIVGEFVEKARHEVSTSDIQEEKTASFSRLVSEGEKDGGKSSGQFASGRTQLKDEDSRRLSGGSGVKGPSDEIWDVTDPSVEPPEKEVPESSTATENRIIRRTGGSLWSIIANIVRLRWGSHAEIPKSTRKSGTKSLSNESVGSEAYFSGHDTEETTNKNGKRERRRMPREEMSSPQVQLIQTTSQGQEIASDIVAANSRRVLELDTPSPSIRLKSGSTSKGISSPEGDEYHVFSDDGKRFEVFSPTVEGGESSVIPLQSSGRSSPIRKESFVVGESNISGKGQIEPLEQPVIRKQPEVSGTEGKDGELKRRMLQRNKQVMRDRFDEWEEAYIRESEQRKFDEMFMREALVEAKKAADTWEVPVGAVLVQHGKIVARGYNLVEELRDATAHAEMICIREASNQLRSWRLSDTTLYVTLEPCPMCAGAILQARIDTLVWGAPNKLVGADGSWIRLFSSGGEGRNGSEPTDKPAAPAHPFHPKMTIRRGILESECAEAMQQFFQLRRRKKEKNEDLSPEPSCLPIATRQSKVLNKLHDIFHVMFCL